MRYRKFEFIVSDQVQVNPDNLRAMSAFTFLLFKLNAQHKAGKTVDNMQKHLNYLEWKIKICHLNFITDIPQAVAFLVFLEIASSVRESMSASDKSSNFESAEAMV